MELLKSCEKLIGDTYPLHNLLFRLEYAVWGSYNLRCMLNRSQRNLRTPKYHFSFSSIISLMAPLCKGVTATNANSYRNKMIQAEMDRELCYLSEDECAAIDYLCMDFMEERFPIITVGENILTLSDALRETGISSKLLVEPFSEEYLDLWKENALSLIDFLKKRFKPEQIILVKNYLCEGYGRYGVEHPFPEAESIRSYNLTLEEYYLFFEKHFIGIKSDCK